MLRLLNPQTLSLAVAIVLTSTQGCEEKNSQIAREGADRQAQQNTEMAQVNKEVAAGSHQLVEADAKARQEIVGVHRDLQAERSRLEADWTELHAERKEIATELRTESTFVSVAKATGYLFLVVTVLGFCW